MAAKKYKITVLGSGSWGTALSEHLSKAGHAVTLWGRNKETLREISEKHSNSSYFPGISLSPQIQTAEDVTKAVEGAECVVFSTPSTVYQDLAKSIAKATPKNAFIVSTAKGFQKQTQNRLSEILSEHLGHQERIAVLSGPSFASEVIRGLPTALVSASKGSEASEKVAEIFHHGSLRVYTSDDVIGVECGGAIKNSIALASGIVDGLNLGSNARAALITRGLAEMKRLILAMGGKSETVSGLSGLGDLILTATGDLSRNRQVGMRLGAGESLAQILSSMHQVAESIETTPKIALLAEKYSISMPIIDALTKVLTREISPKECAAQLLSRGRTSE